MSQIRLALLNPMIDSDIGGSIQAQRGMGLRDLDLKDRLFGKDVLGLTAKEAEQVRMLAVRHGMTVYCLSTSLFSDDIDDDRMDFDGECKKVEHIASLVEILQPQLVRVLSCQSRYRPAGADVGEYLDRSAAWVLDCYRYAVERFSDSGVLTTIENAVDNSILANPQDVLSFFAALDMGSELSFTWDIQNMWQMGTWPTVEVYEELRPFIGYVHLKGGRAGGDGTLRWRSSLRDASWPVGTLVRKIAVDGASPVVCLNPPHGEAPEGWSARTTTEDDLRFVRELGVVEPN